MKVGILNLNIGNIHSVYSAIKKIGFECHFVENSNDIKDCSHLIIAGIGNYQNLMKNINNKGFYEGIMGFARLNKPILGICAGMQVLSSLGLESERTKGLNLIPGEVVILNDNKKQNLLPHIGWNNVNFLDGNELFKDIKNMSDFYFVHSFHFKVKNLSHCLANSFYLQKFCSAIKYKKIYGVQFHPEKSQKNGLKLLKNFCNIK